MADLRLVCWRKARKRAISGRVTGTSDANQGKIVPTPFEIAQWMVTEVERTQFLYQDEVAPAIKEKFGIEFTYINENGNLAIRKDILAAFRKCTEGVIVWEKSGRLWRKREAYDGPGKRGVE